MPYYKVFFRYVAGGKVRRGKGRVDASDKEDAKKRVIKGEKPRLIAVDRVERV